MRVRAGRPVWSPAEASLTRGPGSSRDSCGTTAAAILVAVGKQMASLSDTRALVRTPCCQRSLLSAAKSHSPGK